jgi:hypothetical protein
MAKTSFSQVPAGLIADFSKGLKTSSRFAFSRFTRNILFVSRKRKAGLNAKTLLPQISALWNSLTIEQRTAWGSAGAVVGLAGFKLFTQDTTLRIVNDIAGTATPNLIYQSLVGRIAIQSPANSIKLTQTHPREYWVSAPVRGKKGMRTPVKIVEDFQLPLTLKWSFKTDLTSTGAGSFVKYYAIIYSLYQGRTIETVLSVSCEISDGWKELSATISNVLGYAKSYALFIEAYNVQGDIFFDNVSAEHSGQNWVRDFACLDVNESFTKAFFQVPKNWGVINMPAGAFFDSIYYN